MSLKTVSTELEKIIPRAIIDLTKEDTEDEVDQDAIEKTVEELDETVKNQRLVVFLQYLTSNISTAQKRREKRQKKIPWYSMRQSVLTVMCHPMKLVSLTIPMIPTALSMMTFLMNPTNQIIV